MDDATLTTVLTAGLQWPRAYWQAPPGMLFQAETGKAVLEMMRVMDFDLLVLGDRLQLPDVWETVRRMRQMPRKQPWALYADGIDERNEIAARSQGVCRIFSRMPNWMELLELSQAVSGCKTSTGSTERTLGASA